MRETPGATDLALSKTLAGAAGWGPVMASWRDGVLLTPNGIPVTRGKLTASTSLKVPDRLEFTVPEYADGMSWVPGDDTTHPLAEYGQQIIASIRVTSAVRGEWVTRLGVFQVDSWDHDDLAHDVKVSAFGVLQLAKEWEFTVPEGPRVGGTLGTEFRRLCPAGMSVYIDVALTDRPCPQSFQWPSDRLAALYEIADAWPARMSVDQWGTVNLSPILPDVPTPVLTFADGEGGTLISAPRGSTRQGRPNRVVATGSSADRDALDPVIGVADVESGPMMVREDGTGYHVVTERTSSPLLETSAQAEASARTTLTRLSRPTRVLSVECAPDPRVELDDPVAVVRSGRTDWGYVVSYTLPLTVEDGAMSIDVGVTA
jgi:hypothetical protein